MATSGYDGDKNETDRRISNREIFKRKKEIIAKAAAEDPFFHEKILEGTESIDPLTGNLRGPYSYKSGVAMARGREYKGRDLITGMENADLRTPQDSSFLPYENSGEIVGFDPNKSSSVFGKPDTPPSDKKAGKRTKKTRKSKKSRKRIKSKKNRKSKKNNKSRKRKRISKMPMELPRELKTTGGFGEPGKRRIPRSISKAIYNNILKPIRRGTDRVGLTHYYQPQPQYPDQEEY